MDKVERAKALRERFKAKGGLPYVKSGRVRRAYVVLPKPAGRGFVSLGPALNGKPSEWVKAPDAKPKMAPRPKHNTGTSALASIAAKAPKKLVRAYATAELALAARKQQRRP